ncbi:MAG: A24 family peptidase [Dehalococcoidia bacterium]|nr:A24 family peptidase [Dehalococcoidia bacterium]
MAYVAIVDLRTRRIPNVITLPGIALAIGLAATGGTEALTSAILGAGLALLVTGVMYAAARGQFGMGDVKLAGLGGAVLGVAAVPAYLVVASLLAAVAAVAVLSRGANRHATIAYGPYLAAAGVICCCLAGPVAG